MDSDVSVPILLPSRQVFGGTEEPCAQVYLGSIGVLGTEKKNAEVSDAIASALQEFKVKSCMHACALPSPSRVIGPLPPPNVRVHSHTRAAFRSFAYLVHSH
jgi:hypothetical protein